MFEIGLQVPAIGFIVVVALVDEPVIPSVLKTSPVLVNPIVFMNLI